MFLVGSIDLIVTPQHCCYYSYSEAVKQLHSTMKELREAVDDKEQVKFVVMVIYVSRHLHTDKLTIKFSDTHTLMCQQCNISVNINNNIVHSLLPYSVNF